MNTLRLILVHRLIIWIPSGNLSKLEMFDLVTVMEVVGDKLDAEAETFWNMIVVAV